MWNWEASFLWLGDYIAKQWQWQQQHQLQMQKKILFCLYVVPIILIRFVTHSTKKIFSWKLRENAGATLVDDFYFAFY